MAAVAGRYARAFAEVVSGQKMDPEKTIQEFREIASLVQENQELRNVFQSPAVDHKQKIALLDAIIKKMNGSKMLRNFVAVLIDKRRIGEIGDIFEQFRQDLDARMGIADAQVLSARQLSDVERKSMEAQITALSGKRVRATYSEDPSLLGGAVVRIGSTIYDGSVRGQLERMKQQISGTN
jgi:F-type H+-transporting ATPase subunit delta